MEPDYFEFQLIRFSAPKKVYISSAQPISEIKLREIILGNIT
jgi:hypothetical protein